MKLLVPLRMPRIEDMRFPVRHSDIAATIGIPPPIAASKAIDRPASRAA